MFPWLETGLAFAVAASCLDFYLCWRQYRRYRDDKEPPAKVKDVVTLEEFQQSCAYQGDCMRFGLFEDAITEPISWALLYFKFYPWLWHKSSSFVPSGNEYLISLIFIGISVAMSLVESIPFSLYKDFVIEERHGFNKKTLGLFFMDLIKGLFLAIVFGGPLVLLSIFLVRWAGPNCWIYLWFAAQGLMILFMFLTPYIIMPLFNKYEPLQDQELKGKIEALAARLKYPLTKLYQMDGSKRSGHSNAFMYGFWRNKRIVLYDTLLHIDHEALVGVLAHELGHWHFSHMLKSLVLESMVLLPQLYLFKQLVFNPDPYESFGFHLHNNNPVIIGMFIFSLMLTPVAMVLGIFTTMLSRLFEFQADRFAVKLGYAKDLTRALRVLEKDNKATLNPDPWYSWYKYTHPPMAERLEAIEAEDKKRE